MADAAQDFLDDKLSKNRFTIKQQERLDASGGPSVAGYGDGVVPGGSAYAKYGQMPGSDSSTSGGSSSGGGRRGIAKGGDLDHYGNMYESKSWGNGKLGVEELAAKYGLDRSAAGGSKADLNIDAGHIWSKDEQGGDVYVGKTNMELGANKDLIKAHSTQLYGDEINHFEEGTNLSSFGDIQGALLTELKSGSAKTEPEKERTPIEHSPEMKQATARVRAYEDNIFSGKTSENIFGSYDTGLDLGDKQESATNSGETGVGTSTGAEPASKTATYSFLDSQKSDIKKSYNFKPKTDISYGAN